MGEPSLSRLHKIVETATNEAEAIINNQLLISVRLLCYYAGELLASSRLHCRSETNELGLDMELCRQLLDEAENLALSTESLISEIRRARVALSKLFKWFRAVHANLDKKTDARETDDIQGFKSQDYREIATLLGHKHPIHALCLASKTEILLNLQVMRLLSKPGEAPNVGVSGVFEGSSWPPPSHHGKQEVTGFSDEQRLPVVRPENFGDENSFTLHQRLCAVELALNKVFTKTRKSIMLTVKPICSVQFPAEPLNELHLKARCSFTAHIPNFQRKDSTSRKRYCDSLQNVSASIQASPERLWLLKSEQHNTIRFWVGLKVPRDTSVIQASFYAHEQGNRSKHLQRLALLARRRGNTDEIWLVDGENMLEHYGACQFEPASSPACLVDRVPNWSSDVYDSTPTRILQPHDMKIFGLVRACSSRLYVSGCRGVACVVAAPSFITFYDLEDQESEDDDGDCLGDRKRN